MEMAANTGAVAPNLWEEHVHSHVMTFNQLVLYIIPCVEVERREGGERVERGEERRGEREEEGLEGVLMQVNMVTMFLLCSKNIKIPLLPHPHAHLQCKHPL